MESLQRKTFQPDYRNLVMAARNQWAPRMPLYEHGVGEKVIFETTGKRPYQAWFSKDMEESRQAFREFWDFWKQMGYDTASMEFGVCGALIGGGALGEHKEGCIKNREDFEKYPWEEIPHRYFERYGPYIRNFMDTRPEGMSGVGGVGNGLFEAVQDLVGYINLCYIKGDDEELFRDVFQAMGEVEYRIWKRFLEEYAEGFCVLRFGDDLGFNTMPLLPPDDIRRNIIQQYRRITDLVHARGKPFLLHSCGNIFTVFDELIDDAKIDAKHSNEDGIAPFPVWVERYGDRIGNFGGVDADVLCRYDAAYIRDYVLDCLEKVTGHGGIAFGSGNSIPDYVPTEGFLAMVDTVREWRRSRGGLQ